MTDAARAVLWDLDGTLIDSAEYHWLAWREILAGEGFDLTREQFASSFGQRNDTVLRGHFGPEFPVNEIARIGDAKEARYRELIQAGGIELLPGARRWLAVLAEAGWRQAVASSAPRLNIEAILAALGIETLLASVVAAEDVRHGK
ncbi:MAG TPA: HAD hydrolase-like protein, partial [Ardenticatenaceae bacterium]|nr:HAD hydrolase-like protein [Ardenticatenaceae bacterium]